MGSLKNDYPVLSGAYTTIQNGHTIPRTGHFFLINQYQVKNVKISYRYVRIRYPLPPGTVDKWMPDQTDENGNIIRYAYTKEEIVEDVNYYISMNWGSENGKYDQVFYNPHTSWNVGEYSYNLDHTIFVESN